MSFKAKYIAHLQNAIYILSHAAAHKKAALLLWVIVLISVAGGVVGGMCLGVWIAELVIGAPVPFTSELLLTTLGNAAIMAVAMVLGFNADPLIARLKRIFHK
jgi:hypothetical protein